MTENEAVLSLVIHDVKAAIEQVKSKDTFDIVVAACEAGKNHFMITDPNWQIKGVFGGLLDHFGKDSKEYRVLELEIKVMAMLEAAMRGMPIDFTQMPELPEGEKSLGVGRVWRAIHKGEDLAAVRREIEGTPEPKTAPEWWKSDGPDKTWEQFLEVDNAKSNAERICSNVEFQKRWLEKALEKLGIALPVPHPEYPEDVELKEDGLGILVESIKDLREDDWVPLTPEELKVIEDTMRATAVDDALERYRAMVRNEAMDDMGYELKNAALRREPTVPAGEST